MPSRSLRDRVAVFNRDYSNVMGSYPAHFVCPIRCTDEAGELIKGHVISRTLQNCSRIWVPQRGDVDGVFGTVAAEFQKNFVARIENPADLLADKKAYKQVRPKLELNGVKLQPYYDVSRKADTEVPLVIPVPVEQAEGKDVLDIDVVIDRDDRAVALMAALHAAHLTMFYLNGYKYVFSVSGRFMADILNDYCTRAMPLSRADRVKLATEYCDSLRWMHAPLVGAEGLEGTVEDRKFLVVSSENEAVYAWGIIVRFDTDRIAVFIPLSPETEDLYFDQLDGKSSQLYVRVARLVGSGLEISHVEMSPGAPAKMVIIAD